jgi:hypothetical protein
VTSRTPVSMACIFLVVIAVYAKVSMAFYCGYDDFFEIHRAAFEDKRNPSHIFTTTHFNTSKYRPLSRTLSFVTYWIGGGSPLLYRLRNLTFHLLAVALVYGLGLAIFRAWSVAVAAALLFGLHPLANQTVVAAVFTITASDSLMLMALLFFVYALQSKRRQLLWLMLSLTATWISLFLYEASITIFGFLYGYLAIEWLQRRTRRLDRRFLVILASGSGLILASFFAARLLNVSVPTHMTPIGLIVKNALLYAGALVFPIDLVLAHDLFGTPLPSEMHPGLLSMRVLVILFIALTMLLGCVILWRKQLAARLVKLNWSQVVFLCMVICLSLGPFLFFNPHPSETYLHFPAAVYALVLAAVLRQLFEGPVTYTVAIAVCAVLFGVATWDRNERVASCGATARRIASEFPIARWREGSWDIRLAGFPGEPVPTRYGIYGYHGLSTIDVGDPTLPAARDFLQVLSGNEKVEAKVVSPLEIQPSCPAGTCFWVHADGHVVEARLSALSQ